MRKFRLRAVLAFARWLGAPIAVHQTYLIKDAIAKMSSSS